MESGVAGEGVDMKNIFIIVGLLAGFCVGAVWNTHIDVARENAAFAAGALAGYQRAHEDMRAANGPVRPGNCAPSNATPPCLFGEK